jgi:two-component system copper resistance phosphate regulon response regulator CusR
MRVLIVEDQARTAQELLAGLTSSGIEGRIVTSAEAAIPALEAERFDAMVVDVMLPAMSGLDLVKALRDQGRGIPAVFLSAKADLQDRLKGLEVGGDDYLAKPYSILEVVARLRTITRRSSAQPELQARTVADLVWDPNTRRITRGGERIDLTPKEYAIMTLLLDHPGEVLARSQMVQAVWGMHCQVDPNAVDVQILRLRRKVDGPYPLKLIHTLRGVGLVLEVRDSA